ncbi:hypothetical protein [Tsukamurella paurometabola]|uniref:Regulatory protein n=1 Tax=Tsukamurella paurometabola TaxID=2061 RepID=A0ABS5NHA1_TSUPA|nr:hypothetical protein [Tsukamurella paurometabola]MBS4102997.1 hypothetical protein [Tsukamurella paurometabola]
MRLRLDITSTQFIVTRPAEPRLNFETGAPRIDPDSGLALHSVQVLALDDSGGEVLNITVVGDPKVAVTQPVTVLGLVAIPWTQGDRSGVAFRADSITARPGSSSGSAQAASGSGEQPRAAK